MVELITKQSALDAIDKESEFIEREINDATKHPDEYTDNFISFSRERQCGLADAYIAVDELSPVETMTDGDLISRQAAINAVHKYFVGLYNDEPYETDEDGDEVFTDMKSVNAILKHNKGVSKAIKALPSADCDTCIYNVCNYNKVPWESNGELIDRQAAVNELKEQLVETWTEWEAAYNAGVEYAISVIEELPSAEPVDCTDFIRWIRDKVMDEENWELNAVAYGEVIARKLKKLGAVISEGGYYHSTEHGEWIPVSERLPNESDDYLCTIPLDANETYTEVLTFHKGRFYEDDYEWGATYHDDVLAWMPMPTPYKGGDDE